MPGPGHGVPATHGGDGEGVGVTGLGDGTAGTGVGVRRTDGVADGVEGGAPWLFEPQAPRSTVNARASQATP